MLPLAAAHSATGEQSKTKAAGALGSESKTIMLIRRMLENAFIRCHSPGHEIFAHVDENEFFNFIMPAGGVTTL
jgi:hypothetical protein